MKNKNIRHKIAEDVVKSGWLKQQCRSVCKDKSLVNDLQQEVLLIILQYRPQSALDRAYKENNHLGLIRRIITNNYYSNTSPFFSKYRKYQLLQCEYEDDSMLNEDDDEE